MIAKSALHYARFVAGFDEPQTQTTMAERDLLAAFLPGAKRIVEIGVFEGRTTRMLAERDDADAVIYGIDPFFAGRFGVCWGERLARRYNRPHLMAGKLQLVAKFSTDVDADVPTPVDYVFIDGDHSLDGITADWAYWSKRLKPGGIIALHDTVLTSDKPTGYSLGSIEYFSNHIRNDTRFELVQQQYSLSVLRKR